MGALPPSCTICMGSRTSAASATSQLLDSRCTASLGQGGASGPELPPPEAEAEQPACQLATCRWWWWGPAMLAACSSALSSVVVARAESPTSIWWQLGPEPGQGGAAASASSAAVSSSGSGLG